MNHNFVEVLVQKRLAKVIKQLQWLVCLLQTKTTVTNVYDLLTEVYCSVLNANYELIFIYTQTNIGAMAVG